MNSGTGWDQNVSVHPVRVPGLSTKRFDFLDSDM